MQEDPRRPSPQPPGRATKARATFRFDAYLERLLEEWQPIRPQATVAATGSARARRRKSPPTGGSNRPCSTCRQRRRRVAEGLAFNADWSATALTIDILDQGPGIDPATASRLGAKPSSAARPTDSASASSSPTRRWSSSAAASN